MRRLRKAWAAGKRLLWVLEPTLVAAAMVWAVFLTGPTAEARQTIAGVRAVTASATLNATDTGACSTTGACVTLGVGGYSLVGVQVTGTCGTCTLQFEETIDGTNWVSMGLAPAAGGSAVTSTAAVGAWQGTVPAQSVRGRLSARASGSFVVNLRATLPEPDAQLRNLMDDVAWLRAEVVSLRARGRVR